jgi:hypothetical protein
MMTTQTICVLALYGWICWRADDLYELGSLWFEVTKGFMKGEYEK